MKKLLFLLPFTLLLATLRAQNQPPVISNMTVTANWATEILTVQYDLADAENDSVEITVLIGHNCSRYPITLPASGDVGFPVEPGAGHFIFLPLFPLAGAAGDYNLLLVADDRQPFDLEVLVAEVDSNRLRADLEFVQGIRHRTAGAAHLAAVRDSIQNLFAAQGLCTDEQAFPYSTFTGRNVIGTLPGTTDPLDVVILDAHYDTVDDAPGADDNGSGVVGLLEAARLLSRYPSQKPLRFIGFDLEEAGLKGSIAYVQNGIPAGDTVDGVLNFEMIGYYSDEPNSQTAPAGFDIFFPTQYNELAGDMFRGNFITNIGNTNSTSLANLFDNTAAMYVPDLKVTTIIMPGNGFPDFRRSDHAPFWDAGDQALLLTDGAEFRNPYYHTPQDSIDKLNFTFMANVVRATVATAARRAGSIHGDWATATFQGSVATGEPQGCAPAVSFQPAGREILVTLPEGCTLTKATLEVYDAKGARVFSSSAIDGMTGSESVTLPTSLPAGIYLVRVRAREGEWSRRIVVAN